LGRIDEATAMLDRAAAVTPFDWRIFQQRGVIETLEGRASDAVESLRRAAELVPKVNPAIQNPLANALYATGSYAEAAREAELAMQVQPLAPVHHLIRGKALYAMGEATEARKEFETCATRFRRRLAGGEDVAGALAESEQLLAFALLAEERPGDAVAPVERLAGDSPDVAAAAVERIAPWLIRAGASAGAELWACAAGVLVDAGRLEDAHELLSQAETAFPDNVESALIGLRARALLAEGRTEDATALLNMAPETAQASSEFMLAQAMAHAQSGQNASAALEFRALIDRVDAPPRIRRRAAEGLASLPDQ
jgi:tetratricopeptide (TPR) repeat protein